MESSDSNPASAGVLAAELLAGACGTGDDLHLATVRGLAEDLGRRLSSLSGSDAPDAMVEAALICSDLATLAACNAPVLPERDRPAAAAATHLAAGTTRALVALAGSDAAGGVHARNASRDARSAGWKADLAERQLG